MKVTACIPCYNRAATIEQAMASLARQSMPPDEILVVDDGSSDASAVVAERTGARVVRHDSNLGRGAARATAVREARGEFILFCDAGMALESDFLERALGLLSDKDAGAFGWVQSEPNSAAERWRARHLFKSHAAKQRDDRALLATTGALLRRKAILEAGNFNAELRAEEDAELGRRLLGAGWNVIFSPELRLRALAPDNFRSVLRRYARWNNAAARPDWSSYPKLVAYSIRTMAAQDLQAGDLPAALLSLLCPHYQFWCAPRERASEHRRTVGKPA